MVDNDDDVMMAMYYDDIAAQYQQSNGLYKKLKNLKSVLNKVCKIHSVC